MAMTTMTLNREQRDTLRFYISSRATTDGHDVFPAPWHDVPEDREKALASLDSARRWLDLLDRIGWELKGEADEYVIDLGDAERDLLLSLKGEIERTYEYDHRPDDKAALDAVLALKAVA